MHASFDFNFIGCTSPTIYHNFTGHSRGHHVGPRQFATGGLRGRLSEGPPLNPPPFEALPSSLTFNPPPFEAPSSGPPGRVKPWRLRGRRGGLHDENSKRAHLRVPAIKNTNKIQRKDPKRDRRMKIVAGGGTKSEILGGPAEGCPAEGGSPEGGSSGRVHRKWGAGFSSGFWGRKQKQTKTK